MPWLEEVVIQTAERERVSRIRTGIGATPQHELNYMTRQRLSAEAALWAAIHPEQRRKDLPPAQKNAAKDTAPKGEWLGDKKLPPSLFPDLVPPPAPDETDPKGVEKFAEQFAKQCPRLSGRSGLTIEATDDALRRTLKARLHQGAIELQRRREMRDPWMDRSARSDCVDDVLATANELFGDQHKERIAWLEELLLDAKRFERDLFLSPAARPTDVHTASRVRLKIEAELWKAKNAK